MQTKEMNNGPLAAQTDIEQHFREHGGRRRVRVARRRSVAAARWRTRATFDARRALARHRAFCLAEDEAQRGAVNEEREFGFSCAPPRLQLDGVVDACRCQRAAFFALAVAARPTSDYHGAAVAGTSGRRREQHRVKAA